MREFLGSPGAVLVPEGGRSGGRSSVSGCAVAGWATRAACGSRALCLSSGMASLESCDQEAVERRSHMCGGGTPPQTVRSRRRRSRRGRNVPLLPQWQAGGGTAGVGPWMPPRRFGIGSGTGLESLLEACHTTRKGALPVAPAPRPADANSNASRQPASRDTGARFLVVRASRGAR